MSERAAPNDAYVNQQLQASPGGTIHAYYKAQGFESCPRCGEWIAEQSGRTP